MGGLWRSSCWSCKVTPPNCFRMSSGRAVLAEGTGRRLNVTSSLEEKPEVRVNSVRNFPVLSELQKVRLKENTRKSETVENRVLSGTQRLPVASLNATELTFHCVPGSRKVETLERQVLHWPVPSSEPFLMACGAWDAGGSSGYKFNSQ